MSPSILGPWYRSQFFMMSLRHSSLVSIFVSVSSKKFSESLRLTPRSYHFAWTGARTASNSSRCTSRDRPVQSRQEIVIIVVHTQKPIKGEACSAVYTVIVHDQPKRNIRVPSLMGGLKITNILGVY